MEILITCLIASVLINILFVIVMAIETGINGVSVWYIFKLLKKLSFVTENIDDFLDDIESYAKHLKALYELPSFYGDETMKGLVDHTRVFFDQCNGFRESFSVDSPLPRNEIEEMIVGLEQELEEADNDDNEETSRSVSENG